MIASAAAWRINRYKGFSLQTFLIRIWIAFFVLAFPFSGALAAAGAPGVDLRVEASGLVAHKALYDIRLVGTKSGSQIANVSGQMLFEWQPTCDAWSSKHRFNLSYEYADSPATRVASDFSTFEPFDGKSVYFSSQRRRDGELFEELRGRAALDNGAAGAAIYSLPQGLEFDLPQGAVFPLSHTLGVLKAIRGGEKFYNAVVFDGADQDGPVEINAFIGKAVGLSPDFRASKEFDLALLQSPAREVRLAFFPLNEPAESSDYEMTVTFHENGIISDMFIEYDDFSVTQKLIALQSLPDACSGGEKKN